MNFGVSGSIGACSSHIYSNPVTQAAVKRQQEKERLAREQALLTAEQRRRIEQERLIKEENSLSEERWQRQFLQMIYAMKSFNESKRVLDEMMTVTPIRETMGDIIRTFAIKNNVSVFELHGKSRMREIVLLRHELWYEIHIKRPDKSYAEIGRLFNRDHTSILAGIGNHALKNGIDHPLSDFAQRKKRNYQLRNTNVSLQSINERIKRLSMKAKALAHRREALAA